MNKKIIGIAIKTPIKGKEIEGCFYCPLKFNCALHTYYGNHYTVNYSHCDCTDERLVALNKVFNVNNNLLEENKKCLKKYWKK